MKIDSIKENHLFSRAYRSGESFAGRFAVAYRLKKYRTSAPRLGITAGKKLGNAVDRNRSKRLIREAFTSLCKTPGIKPGAYVVVARTRCALQKTKMCDVLSDMKRGFSALGALCEQDGEQRRDEK